VATYLSTPVPLTWPPDMIFFRVYSALTGVLLLGIVGLGLHREKDPRLRVALNLSALAFLLVLGAQQWSFWMEDASKNMGGRYLLAVVPALTLLLVVGLSRLGRLGRFVLPLWIGLLLVINMASVGNIATVLTPQYTPGWHVFQAAPQVEPPAK
jgi:hypothetical protein